MTWLEKLGLRESQYQKAARLANKVYETLELDGISVDSKLIKLALYIDMMKTLGEEIELDTVFKLVGGKMKIQLDKERIKALLSGGGQLNLTFDDLIKSSKMD